MRRTINMPKFSGKHKNRAGFSLALLSIVVISVSIFSCAGPEPPSVKAGFGDRIITPKGMLQMRGFARSQVATGTHDDLHVRSLVIEDVNETAVAIVTVSLCGIGRDIVERIREGVETETGIAQSNVLVTVTHTHSGPSIDKAGPEYQAFVVEESVGSVVDAWNSRAYARIGTGPATVMELGRNRRVLLYGGLHPDPEAGIIKIEDATGKLTGVVFNYGCHPSALDWHNSLYSEDWPYYAIKGIQETLGENVAVAYLQSAQGNINVGYSAELSAVGVDMPVRSYEYIEHKGRQMRDAVLEALPKITTSGAITVDSAQEIFNYPLRNSFPISLSDAERDAVSAENMLASLEKQQALTGTRILDRVRMEVFQTGQRLNTARNFYSSNDHGGTVAHEQQAIRIGNAVFVGLPGEVFAEVGLRIKEESSFEQTFLIGLANGYGGYLPSAKEYIEGDYEVDGCKYSPEAEDVCVESSLKLILKLR